MNKDLSIATQRMIMALGRWEREGTDEARAAHEAARAAVRAFGHPGKTMPRADTRHLRLVWSRPE